MVQKPRTKASKRRQRPSEFAQKLFSEWQRLELSTSAATILVAVSGGADSTALLLALDELNQAHKLSLKLVVTHLNHRLRKASAEDAEWVADLSRKLGYECITHVANVRKRAKETADNLEQSARRARYELFHETAKSKSAEIVVTAHTLDDQAETVLMRLLRGSAAEGLSGIENVRTLAGDSAIKLVRPLVSWARRSETEHYCHSRRIRFRFDEMNDDEQFVRVKVRKQLLPLMQTFNNRIVETLGRTAILLREDAAALSQQAEQLLEQAGNDGKNGSGSLDVKVLSDAPPAIRRRALRQWISEQVGSLRRVEMVHLLAVERLLEGSRGRSVELPRRTTITRKRGRLHLSGKKVEKPPRDL